MAVGRQLNVKGQMRIDVPHLRLIESGVVYDFDTLSGGIIAGKKPYVVTGFTLASWTLGTPASTLSMVTAGSIFVNYSASENGSMLMVPSDRSPELLDVTNSRVIGGFTPSQTNYIGLDLVRLEDPTTTDVVQFIDPATGQATPKMIPLGRTMDYRIRVSTTPFSATPQICPVAIVTTDASNNLTAVTDARPMLFRLASGGDSPNPLGVYSWPQGRTEGPSSFTGGDKAIDSWKNWASAVMQRIWELTGGEYWYSDVTDRNLKFYADMTDSHTRGAYTNNQIWDGTDITWSGFGITFENSTGYINEIADQIIPSPGLTNIAAGECIYVDYDRSTNHLRAGTPLVAHKASLSNIGSAAKPGVRTVIFWRPTGSSKVYSRLDFTAVGQYSGAANTTTYGVVKLASASTVPAGPFVIPADAATGGNAVAAGLIRGALGAGALTIGGTANETSISIQSVNGAINIGTTPGSQNITIGDSTNTGSVILFSAGNSLHLWNTGSIDMSTATGGYMSITGDLDTTIYSNTRTIFLRSGLPAIDAIQPGVSIKPQYNHSGPELEITDAFGSPVMDVYKTSTLNIGTITRGAKIGNGTLTLGDGTHDTTIRLLSAGSVITDTGAALGAGDLLLVRNNGNTLFAVNYLGKASSQSATVVADVNATLTTKGYVDSLFPQAISGNTQQDPGLNSNVWTSLGATLTSFTSPWGRPVMVTPISDCQGVDGRFSYMGYQVISGTANLGLFRIVRDLGTGSQLILGEWDTGGAMVTPEASPHTGWMPPMVDPNPGTGAHTYVLQYRLLNAPGGVNDLVIAPWVALMIKAM